MEGAVVVGTAGEALGPQTAGHDRQAVALRQFLQVRGGNEREQELQAVIQAMIPAAVELEVLKEQEQFLKVGRG